MQEVAKGKVISFTDLINQATRTGRADLAQRLQDARNNLICYLSKEHSTSTIISSDGHTVEFLAMAGEGGRCDEGAPYP